MAIVVFLKVSYKWNPIACYLLRLASFNQHHVCMTYSSSCVYQYLLFFLLLSSTPWYGCVITINVFKANFFFNWCFNSHTNKISHFKFCKKEEMSHLIVFTPCKDNLSAGSRFLNMPCLSNFPWFPGPLFLFLWGETSTLFLYLEYCSVQDPSPSACTHVINKCSLLSITFILALQHSKLSYSLIFLDK